MRAAEGAGAPIGLGASAIGAHENVLADGKTQPSELAGDHRNGEVASGEEEEPNALRSTGRSNGDVSIGDVGFRGEEAKPVADCAATPSVGLAVEAWLAAAAAGDRLLRGGGTGARTSDALETPAGGPLADGSDKEEPLDLRCSSKASSLALRSLSALT